jgi:hypothetical protein
MISLQLPNYRDIGQVRRWFLPLPIRTDVSVPTQRGDATAYDESTDELELEYYRTIARFIGYGSSWTDNHWDHTGPYVEQGKRCNACRWFEIRIMRELDVDPADVPPETDLAAMYDRALRDDKLGRYVVYKAGMSSIPGEVPYIRHNLIASPFEVVEALTTRKHTGQRPVAFITKPSALALASGARFDDELKEAYLDRAVS